MIGLLPVLQKISLQKIFSYSDPRVTRSDQVVADLLTLVLFRDIMVKVMQCISKKDVQNSIRG